MRLDMNRWKGAWAILTLLWLAALVSTNWSRFPTQALQEERARVEARGHRPGQTHVDCFPAKPSDRASCPFEGALVEAPISDEDFRSMEEHAVQEARANTTAVQASFVGEGVATWFIPPAVIYLLGLGCAWAARRTRKS